MLCQLIYTSKSIFRFIVLCTMNLSDIWLQRQELNLPILRLWVSRASLAPSLHRFSNSRKNCFAVFPWIELSAKRCIQVIGIEPMTFCSQSSRATSAPHLVILILKMALPFSKFKNFTGYDFQLLDVVKSSNCYKENRSMALQYFYSLYNNCLI